MAEQNQAQILGDDKSLSIRLLGLLSRQFPLNGNNSRQAWGFRKTFVLFGKCRSPPAHPQVPANMFHGQLRAQNRRQNHTISILRIVLVTTKMGHLHHPSYHLCRNRLACECARKHADSSLRLARISNFVVGPVTIRVGCSETKEILTWRPIIKYRYRTIPPTKLLDMSFYLRETHTEKFSNKILTV